MKVTFFTSPSSTLGRKLAHYVFSDDERSEEDLRALLSGRNNINPSTIRCHGIAHQWPGKFIDPDTEIITKSFE